MKLLLGNCLEQLKKFDDNSVDSIVTDPPYELSFMGKSWDSTGIANNVEMWKECLRVLKPGGHLLSFSGSRTYHRMACAIEDAGFEVRDMIEWVYGSGFTKSLDIGKAVDKLDAKDIRRKRNLSFTAWMRSSGITAKQINEATGSFMGSHYLTEGEQPAVATLNMFEKIKHLLPEPPSDIMQLMVERTVESENFKKRQVIGKKQWTNSTHHFIPGEDHTERVKLNETKGTSEWEGWGTTLKPAHEPICMARKPLEKGLSVAENCLKWGTGGINIDESRVEYNDGTTAEDIKRKYTGNNENNGSVTNNFGVKEIKMTSESTLLGRFPANLIHDNSEEVRECFPNESSRFFKSIIYTAKASKSERNMGLDDLPKKPGGSNAKGYTKDVSKGLDRNRPVDNFHPTVKPIALMEYLITMVAPKNGVVLDPFMGSGSTGIAAVKNGYDFIGIELIEEYLKIAETRINYAK